MHSLTAELSSSGVGHSSIQACFAACCVAHEARAALLYAQLAAWESYKQSTRRQSLLDLARKSILWRRLQLPCVWHPPAFVQPRHCYRGFESRLWLCCDMVFFVLCCLMHVESLSWANSPWFNKGLWQWLIHYSRASQLWGAPPRGVTVGPRGGGQLIVRGTHLLWMEYGFKVK
jgi:hypothetical protein